MMGPVLSSGPDSSNKYIMEATPTSLLKTIMMDWITKSTSMSFSMLNSVPKAIVSEMVVDVDVVCGDGLRKIDDKT